MQAQVISTLKLVGKFAFAAGILLYMVQSGRLDLQVVRQGFASVSTVLAASGLVLIGLIVSQFRWGLLMKGQGITYTTAQLFRYGMIGSFFNTTMPGAVSGDLIKAWYVLADRKGQRKTPVLTSILLDRVLGVFGLVVVAASPLIFFGRTVWATPALRGVALPLLGCFGGVVVFFAYVLLSGWGPFALLRSKLAFLERNKAGALLLQTYDAMVAYRDHPGALFLALLFSMINFLCMVGVSILCGNAIGETALSTYQYFLLVPIGMLATAIPIAPAGLGVGHAAFRALFLLVGSSHGSEIFTMLVTVQILFNLTGVFFYLRSPKIAPEPVAPA